MKLQERKLGFEKGQKATLDYNSTETGVSNEIVEIISQTEDKMLCEVKNEGGTKWSVMTTRLEEI